MNNKNFKESRKYWKILKMCFVFDYIKSEIGIAGCQEFHPTLERYENYERLSQIKKRLFSLDLTGFFPNLFNHHVCKHSFEDEIAFQWESRDLMDNIPPLQLKSSGTFCQRCSRAVMARHFVYQNVGRSAPRGAWTGVLNRRTCLPSHRAFQMDLPGPLRSLVYTCV